MFTGKTSHSVFFNRRDWGVKKEGAGNSAFFYAPNTGGNMARIDAPAQVKCFLDLIAWSEGTAGIGDDGYNKIVNPGKFFTDYSDHPNQLIQLRPGLKSTAAGRYQQLYKWWPTYKKQLKLADFGPTSQDKLAIQLINECRAYQDILDGKIATAIKKCSSRWASFPGAGYGQPEHSMAALLAQFAKLGGTSKEKA